MGATSTGVLGTVKRVHLDHTLEVKSTMFKIGDDVVLSCKPLSETMLVGDSGY